MPASSAFLVEAVFVPLSVLLSRRGRNDRPLARRDDVNDSPRIGPTIAFLLLVRTSLVAPDERPPSGLARILVFVLKIAEIFVRLGS
jgi:hypothetical protein